MKTALSSRTILLVLLVIVLCVSAFLYFNRTKYVAPVVVIPSDAKTVMLAGGCFWCVESDLQKATGVIDVVSGYAGGRGENPTYQNYAENGFREVVEVTYDPKVTNFQTLALWMMAHSDPTDGEGSFHDRGPQYAPAIYYGDEGERAAALSLIDQVDAAKIYDKPLAVAVLPRVKFWAAEEYHQDYSKKNSLKYEFYRSRSGRDDFVKKYIDKLEVLMKELKSS